MTDEEKNMSKLTRLQLRHILWTVPTLDMIERRKFEEKIWQRFGSMGGVEKWEALRFIQDEFLKDDPLLNSSERADLKKHLTDAFSK